MKKVISISLGSSHRNHQTVTKINGQQVSIERIGTDGDVKLAEKLIRELDGKVDAFGLGGIDLYIFAGQKRYVLREAWELAKAAQKTPVVDGSGLKNTLERNIVLELLNDSALQLSGKRVLLVSGVDRFGMAEAFAQSKCPTIFGDLIFTLGIPYPLTSLEALVRVARVIAPIATKLPIKMLYPTGEAQKINSPRYRKFFDEAEIIAGDFHFIRRNMPEKLHGKTILTNTVTEADRQELAVRGVRRLITTTPVMEGRSFGTNVMEAVLVALSEQKRPLTRDEYLKWLPSIKQPKIFEFKENELEDSSVLIPNSPALSTI